MEDDNTYTFDAFDDGSSSTRSSPLIACPGALCLGCEESADPGV